MEQFCYFLGILMGTILQHSMAIVGRDLLLTPKPGLQLSGKRIFYEEPHGQQQGQQRPWERTLKHVTYVTLFTDAALGATAGNLSQMHDYHAFLQTPYVPLGPDDALSVQSRFGDIVTLAHGRLEQLAGNGSYRFVEGNCGHGVCEGRPIWALWQVQKVRHRVGVPTVPGQTSSYHYEMKFSITPLHQADRLFTSTKAIAHSQQKPSWLHWQQTARPHQSFIQKEADYPQTFGRIVYNDERDKLLAERRFDRSHAQAEAEATAASGDQQQATFVHGIFHAAPQPTKLNIGEYIKGVPGAPIGLFPNIFNRGLPNYIQPTTFRPNYPMKFALPQDELERYTPATKLTPEAGVTHHFHHHFYIASKGSEAQEPAALKLFTPAPFGHHQVNAQHIQFPTSSTAAIESASLEDQEQDNLIVHVTQQPLRKPQIYGQASKYHASKLPPLFTRPPGSKPNDQFVQSEALEETVFRYSEPDPLYVDQHPIDVLQVELPNVQKPLNDVKPQQPLLNDTEVVSEKRLDIEFTTETPTTAATSAASTEASIIQNRTEKALTVVAAATPVPSFVSTSTSKTPLRVLSAQRSVVPHKLRITAGKSTTTTTTSKPIAVTKWKLRRNATSYDSKAKSSQRSEQKVAFVPPTNSTTQLPVLVPTVSGVVNGTVTTGAPPAREVIEVLTQKSVSKSVSIKVGENGEEIPIIVDDDENVVKST